MEDQQRRLAEELLFSDEKETQFWENALFWNALILRNFSISHCNAEERSMLRLRHHTWRIH